METELNRMAACPACGASTGSSQTFASGETDFRTCNACHLAFRERLPSIAELQQIYAEHYDATRIVDGLTEQESGEFATDRYARFLASGLVPRGASLLDYGTGTGRLVELLRDAGVRADGLEFSADARQFCAAQRGFKLLAGNDEVGAGTYDAVTMVEVIEHLPALMDDLAAIRRSLRPGGLLFVTTPNRAGLRARLQNGLWVEARKKFHLFLFDPASLRSTLLRAGFATVESVRFSPVLKAGWPFWVYGRACQGLGLAGTLCFVARA